MKMNTTTVHGTSFASFDLTEKFVKMNTAAT